MSQPQDNPSTIAAYAISIATVLEQAGIDPGEVFHTCGLPQPTVKAVQSSFPRKGSRARIHVGSGAGSHFRLARRVGRRRRGMYAKRSGSARYSHSMVAGGLLLMS